MAKVSGSRDGKKTRILVGYDGTSAADRMLRDLERAALPSAADVTLVTLVEPWARFAEPKSGSTGWPSAAARDQYQHQLDRIVKSAKTKADKAAKVLARSFPGWKVSAQAELDAPAHGLLTRAEKAKADLIVVGSHGRGLLGRALLGSVSDQVIKHATTDVRVARVGGKAGTRPPRVMVAVDGSAASLKAAEAAARRPWPTGASVRIIGVIDPRYLEGTFLGADMAVIAPLPGSEERTWLEKKLAEAARKFAATGIRPTLAVLSGDPRRELLKEARSWKADAIFLGASGLTAVERLLLGSVTSALAAHAPCSVEIVRGTKRRK